MWHSRVPTKYTRESEGAQDAVGVLLLTLGRGRAFYLGEQQSTRRAKLQQCSGVHGSRDRERSATSSVRLTTRELNEISNRKVEDTCSSGTTLCPCDTSTSTDGCSSMDEGTHVFHRVIWCTDNSFARSTSRHSLALDASLARVAGVGRYTRLHVGETIGSDG